MATSTIWAKQTSKSCKRGGRASDKMFSFSNMKKQKQLAMYLSQYLIILLIIIIIIFTYLL